MKSNRNAAIGKEEKQAWRIVNAGTKVQVTVVKG
jgi:hypothetical protein